MIGGYSIFPKTPRASHCSCLYMANVSSTVRKDAIDVTPCACLTYDVECRSFVLILDFWVHTGYMLLLVVDLA